MRKIQKERTKRAVEILLFFVNILIAESLASKKVHDQVALAENHKKPLFPLFLENSLNLDPATQYTLAEAPKFCILNFLVSSSLLARSLDSQFFSFLSSFIFWLTPIRFHSNMSISTSQCSADQLQDHAPQNLSLSTCSHPAPPTSCLLYYYYWWLCYFRCNKRATQERGSILEFLIMQ